MKTPSIDPLGLPDRAWQRAHDVLETADGHVDGLLQPVDLVVVLHEPELCQLHGELGVGVVRLHGSVDARVVVAERDHVAGRQAPEVRLELAP